MNDTASSWLELAVVAEAEAVEAITELFTRYGYNQGVVIEEPIKPGADGGAEIDPEGLVTVRTYLPLNPENSEEQQAQVQKLREGLWYLGRMLHIEDLQVAEKLEEDWANAWKQYYQVHRLGKRTVIKPPWQPYVSEPDDIVVEIDPGMAFGTGLHPTTRLCLLLAEEQIPLLLAQKENERIKSLDVGTGSGILAIAAAKLGASLTIGVDTDPVAVQSAAENVSRNGLEERIIVAAGSLAVEKSIASGGFYSFPEDAQRVPEALITHAPYDVVLANIIARVLGALANAFALVLKPGGKLIVSGIISEKETEVVQAFEQVGLKILERRSENDWVALLAEKPV
ncbi:50S ribosomal protein L11 methyltransferase [Candidatus Chlorohelix sp.]|uniref:50S ribosomal protein L11 methyltransferase n=1 Tax=Candidatus Chlorohelix sp. TaxID=3139201 RepID=UPI00303C876F